MDIGVISVSKALTINSSLLTVFTILGANKVISVRTKVP